MTVATPNKRAHLVLAWARHRGRVSTTEIADIVEATPLPHVCLLLKALEEDGLLAAGRSITHVRSANRLPSASIDR